MIDLHLHLLPAVDDGAASAIVADAMLKQTQQYGYQTLVTTPHLVEPLTAAYQSHIDGALAQVRQLAIPRHITVLLGFEVALTPDLPQRLAGGEPITLAGGKTVLVELPFTAWPLHAESTLFAIQTAGYRPVLAHPERYLALQDDPERGVDLARRGVILQITIGSLTGLFGRRVQHTADQWLEAGAVDLVATDAHSAGQRLSAVPRGLARLQRLVGDHELRRLTVGTPVALLEDQPLPVAASAPPAKRRWFALRARSRRPF